MNNITQAVLSVVSAVIGLAILSVIISRKSQTPQVLQAASTSLAKVIQAAVSPVATAATNGNLGANTFTTPQADISDFLYNTTQGQLMAKDVFQTISSVGGYN